MKHLELKPILEEPSDYDKIEAKIRELFRKEIYLPIIFELGESKKTLQNSLEDLVSAIKSGQIYFSRGQFTGKFSSSISKELKNLGARWDRKQGSWKIPQQKLPVDVKSAIAGSEARFIDKVKSINSKLASINSEKIADKLKVENLFDTTLFKMERSFKKNIKNLTVSPELTNEERVKIAKGYTENLRRYIKDWTDEETLKLRKSIEKNVLSGRRRENMIPTIQKSYRVSLNKAKFLARQETGLMIAKFKKERYESAGVNSYKWGTVNGSAAHPVRPMHKALAGKIFTWDNPPITDEKGNRNNPGEDYNCRCFARPLLAVAS